MASAHTQSDAASARVSQDLATPARDDANSLAEATAAPADSEVPRRDSDEASGGWPGGGGGGGRGLHAGVADRAQGGILPMDQRALGRFPADWSSVAGSWKQSLRGPAPPGEH